MRQADSMNAQAGAGSVTAAQFHSFANKMPAYYLTFITMMAAIAFVFWPPVAPAWMSVYVPLVCMALGCWRGIWWVRRRHDTIPEAEALRQLRQSTGTLVVVAVGVTLLDAKLFAYGDVHTRYFILIQMIASAMCGFYCLMHLRPAALILFLAVILPFSLLAFSMHQPALTVAAMNCVLTGGVMLNTMGSYRRDFMNMITAKAETLVLSQENFKLAHLDMLTELPNRRHFFDALERAALPLAEGGFAAVGIIDLDGFKAVNDTYGHRVGDCVLEQISARLSAIPGDLHSLSRVGGDEFAFLSKASDPVLLRALGKSIQDAVNRPLHIDGRTTSVGCCVGFAVRHGETAEDTLSLFEKADYALYHSKRSGRACTTLFSDDHETALRQQGLVEQTLRNADLEAEFYPLFQPIMDVHAGGISGFECLARWNSPILGEVSPAVFIPVAERAGLIAELTPILFQKALHVAHQWPDHLQLAFNVSPYDIGSLVKTCNLISLIQESGVSPRRISIELTETALLQSFAETNTHMSMLRAIGVTLSLDDFGTGHSSLSYIHSLPLDRIKVDRTFTCDIDTNPASANIVRSLITLCRDLHLSCVIEGVETEAQLTALQSMNGQLIQGFLFSKPLRAEQIPAYLAGPAAKPPQRATLDNPQPGSHAGLALSGA